MDGVVVVDKPHDWTSHDVVNKMRRIAGTRKIGHLGTLDPMATGVLPLLVNRATRLAQFFGTNEKVYEGTIRFGFSTTTYDAEGERTSDPLDPHLTLTVLEELFDRFRGTFSQVPPPVSAKKIGGVASYKLARARVAVDIPPCEVTVFALDLLRLEGQRLDVRVHCSAGTYVRSIAHDAGAALGCGAHLAALRRLSSGPFTLSQASTLDQLAVLSEAGRFSEALVPASQLLPEFPLEVVDAVTESQIRHGRDFIVSPFRSRGDAKYVKAVTRDGLLVAIGQIVLPNLYHPVVVL